MTFINAVCAHWSTWMPHVRHPATGISQEVLSAPPPPPHCLSSSREIGTSKETPTFKTYGRARVAEM